MPRITVTFSNLEFWCYRPEDEPWSCSIGRGRESCSHAGTSKTRMATVISVKGGEKTCHWGVVVQDKCPPKRSAEMSPVYWGIVSDVDAGRVADDRRVGGVSASMYRLTVSLWRPNSLAILRNGHALELGLLHRVPPGLLQKRRPPRWSGHRHGDHVFIVDDGAVAVCCGYHCQWIRDRFPRFTEAFGVWRLDGIT